MSSKIFYVDAFTTRPFSGNPAAVCILDDPRDALWMQQVAAEINLSETAFLTKSESHFSLRWFTPKVEVDLCGHATLASAHVLWEESFCASELPIRFLTRSGILSSKKLGNWIELDFPSISNEPVASIPKLSEALNVTPVRVRQAGKENYLVEVDSEATLRSIAPDFKSLSQIASGVCVTCRSDNPEFDFLSRCFAPREGIDEDPVTGSAHCFLAPYWKEYLGKIEFVAYQASSRGGVVRAKIAGDRVLLAGQAVTLIKGQLFL